MNDLQTKLLEAIEKKDLAKVENLVRNGADLSFRSDADPIGLDYKRLGYTPLMHAIETQSLKLVKCLVELGSPINPDSERLNSPLIVAVHCHEIKTIEYLLEHGADPNYKCPCFYNDIDCWSPIYWAAFWEMVDVVEVLLQHPVDINEQLFPFDDTPLHRAIYYQNDKMVELLLKSGADTTIKDNSNRTAAEYAEVLGKVAIRQRECEGLEVSLDNKKFSNIAELFSQGGTDVELGPFE